ncbi:hypothetical protein [Kibdelosporangium phytohabitans]|uniref:Uncharacterized protein n=1 Tax=Kibdelosporangium phytohabitans TaxID=860235 RepID=A0A0N9HWH2_9PSEU|nr:hypothetical protein [Kibdelosporangium phytohabitans]ALG06358.1 hypothetical protein AOZ06_04960 [Kibdelosporangium phytohabitans]MBE1467499.1 hypothetical protein [Kibdelosporangium phytohabitans]
MDNSRKSITEADAVQQYPELAPLVGVRDAGWVCRPLYDQHDQLLGLAGSRSVRQYTDAIYLFDRTHAITARVRAGAYGGGCVWVRDGNDIAEVVTDLFTLPAPDSPGAPSLVIKPNPLWTP